MKAQVFPAVIVCLIFSVVAWAGEPNTLTAVEQASGWKLLFDGKSLDGWRGFRTDAPGAGWQVAEGVFRTAGRAGDLMTKRIYGDFELSFEWRTPEAGSGGVLYRIGLGEAAADRTGLEYRIGDTSKAEGNERPNQRAGSLYDLGPGPSKDFTKPLGQWNAGRIVIRGWRVEHWLNGEKLLEMDLSSPAGRAAIAQSKFKDSPKFATFPRGFIALHDPSPGVGFRSIKIRELD